MGLTVDGGCSGEETLLLYKDDSIPPAQGLGRRHLVVLLAFFGLVTSYSLRVNLSVAVVAMVKDTQPASQSNYTGPDTCPAMTPTSINIQNGEFDWSAETQGLILSAFFYGYITTQLIGGQLAQRYGGKAVFGIGLWLTSLLTVLTPVLARTHVWLLVAARIMEGVAEGVTLPAMYTVLSKWSPSSEKTFLGAVALSGNNVGTVLSTSVSGVLAEKAPDGGWPYIFYVFGGFGLLWFMAWMLLVTESPTKDTNITEIERSYIMHTTGMRQKLLETPWRSVVTSLPVWALVVGFTTKHWVYYMLLTTLPSYLQEVLRFNMSQNGLVSSLPFLAMFIVEIIGSIVADQIMNRKLLSTTTIRKLYTGIGLFVPSLLLLVQGYSGCDQVTGVVLLCLATGFIGLTTGGVTVNYYDVAPLHVGTIMGIGNTFATIPGMISPSITKAITQNTPFMSRWRTVFWIALLVSSLGSIFYCIFASGEEQSWAKAPCESSLQNDSSKVQSEESS